MNKIKKISEKYDGNLDVSVQFKDYGSGETVFNLYVQVNEEDLMKVEPMLPEETPETDVVVEIDFEKVYSMIYFTEKEMRGAQTESPPWDKRPRQGFIKGIIDGIKMRIRMNDVVNSAIISPESSSGDVKSLFDIFFKIMEEGDRENMEEQSENEESNFESQEDITGQIISDMPRGKIY